MSADDDGAVGPEPDDAASGSPADDATPIADPMHTARAAEADVIVLESFAARAGVLSKVCLAAGALALVVVLVAFTGRVDTGVVLYVAPMGALHVWLGVMLGRAAPALSDVAQSRGSSRASLAAAVRALHSAFGVQLIAVGFLVFLMAVALLVAATFQRVTEI
ncbi:MAG: hypothetical protein IT377_00720 [Polyangiaceae bacterium]|nr:hypothetical protein [Polyangiaceae bacterium]